jgi:predicted DNA-binding transcriptional regulator YafY
LPERGKGGGWSLLDDYQTKLTGLSPAEIQSLFLARPTRLMSDLGLKRESEAALLKLQASLPAGAREQAELARHRILIDPRGWRDPAESIASLPVLLDAIWRGKQVRFVYARDLCEPAERTGHPLGLVAKGSTWYLVAKVEGETRTYRVSRIRQAAALDRPAAYEPDFDLAAHWEHSAAEFREKLPRLPITYLADTFRVADLHVSRRQEKTEFSRRALQRSAQERINQIPARTCHAAVVPAFRRTGHPFAVSGPCGPSQMIECVFAASPETIRSEASGNFVSIAQSRIRNAVNDRHRAKT